MSMTDQCTFVGAEMTDSAVHAKTNEPYEVVEIPMKRGFGHEIAHRIEGIFSRASEGHDAFAALGGVAGVAAAFQVDCERGIGADSAELRREVFGKNEIPRDAPVTFLDIYLAVWSEKMILILTFGAALTLVLGLTVPPEGEETVDYKQGWIEGVGIFTSVVIVTTISSIIDYRKELKFRKLADDNEAQDIAVIRGGQKETVDVKELVVGDIVMLSAGLVVPVDCFYIRGQCVVIDESSVTGENDPKRKDNSNPFILAGTVVNTAEGAWALVGAVGVRSFGGKLLMESRNEGAVSRATPLQLRLDRLAQNIAYFGIASAILLFIVMSIVELTKLGRDRDDFQPRRFLDFLIISVAILVVAVPEGLPLAVTIALAYAQNTMRADSNQVRRLKACEIMGNATQICSDKTGTLTQNLMSVVQGHVAQTHFKISRPGEVLEPIALPGVPPPVIETLVNALALNSSSEKSWATKARDGTPLSKPKWVWDLDKKPMGNPRTRSHINEFGVPFGQRITPFSPSQVRASA